MFSKTKGGVLRQLMRGWPKGTDTLVGAMVLYENGVPVDTL